MCVVDHRWAQALTNVRGRREVGPEECVTGDVGDIQRVTHIRQLFSQWTGPVFGAEAVMVGVNGSVGVKGGMVRMAREILQSEIVETTRSRVGIREPVFENQSPRAGENFAGTTATDTIASAD